MSEFESIEMAEQITSLRAEIERLTAERDAARAALHWSAQNCLDRACVRRAIAALEQKVKP